MQIREKTRRSTPMTELLAEPSGQPRIYREPALHLEDARHVSAMAPVVADGRLEPTLRSRAPGYAAIQRCLAVQDAARRRSVAARLLGADPLRADARPWYRAALGEIEVARELVTLGPDWIALHAVPTGRGPIDHVVIGPSGIFTISTENCTGSIVKAAGEHIVVDGREECAIRAARSQARRAAERLGHVADEPVEVTPLVVVVGASSLSRSRRGTDVAVLTPRTLRRRLLRMPRVHSERALEYFALIAEERATWHDRPVGADDLDHVSRFARLRREVDRARHIAHVWRLVGASAAITGTTAGLLLLSTVAGQSLGSL